MAFMDIGQNYSGIENAVTSGTADCWGTRQDIKQRKRVIITYDGDKAGTAATH